VTTRAARAAARTRNYHRARIGSCRSVRGRMWATIAWLAAEIRKAPDDAAEAAIEAVRAMAQRLNEGRASRDRA
jgi:hypothetical protein